MDPKLSLLTVSLLILINSTTGEDVTVEFSSNREEYEIGQAILLSCTVNGPFNKARDDLLIDKENARGVSTTIVTEEGKTANAPENVVFTGWYASIKSVHVIVYNLSRSDWGTYSCKVVRHDSKELVAQDSVTVDVPFPPLGPPACKTLPNVTTWYDGDEVTLQCTADSGYPPATLEWYQSSGDVLPKSEVKTSRGIITATVTFNLDLDHNDVIFNCIRFNNDLSSTNVSTCLLGVTVLNKTETALTLKQVGVIAGASVVPLLIVPLLIIVCIVFAILLVRAKRSKLSNDYETPIEDANQDKLLGGLAEDKNQNNTSKIELKLASITSPNPTAIYASVQKNKTNGEPIPASRTSSKVYPNPPSYPRPPPIRQCMKVGEQYANTTVGANSQYESNADGAYQNSPVSPNNISRAKSSKRSMHEPEKTVYLNTLDVGPTENVNGQVATDYENTNITGKPRVPAPTQPPPAPPPSTTEESYTKPYSHTPGLEYAELDTVMPSTSTARKSSHLNEPVIYAAVKP